MNEIKTNLNKFNLDMTLSGIAGALILLIFRNRFEILIYRFMLIFSPIIPDIFISAVYLDIVCAFIGVLTGLSIYIIWNKKSKNILKWLVVSAFMGLILINVAFLIDTTYTSKQLKRPLEELSADSRFYPTRIDISFNTFVDNRLMVGNRDVSEGKSRALMLKKSSPAMKYIYEGIQSLSGSVFYDSDYNSLNTVSISYDNNKRYKSIWIRMDETCSYQVLNGISGRLGTVRHNSEVLHERTDEIMKESRKFNENKKVYFTALWFNAENTGDVRYKDISKKDLLYDAMSSLQNYNPGNEEKDYYNEFFTRKSITVEDGDLIAIFYTFDTEDYVYEDVALYDRTKKLLIFKGENNEMEFVEKDIDSIFE